MLKLVLPKGSLEEHTLRLFEAADLRVRRGSDRDYHGTVDDERIERVSILRPQEIPLYVQDGLFDLGYHLKYIDHAFRRCGLLPPDEGASHGRPPNVAYGVQASPVAGSAGR